MDNTTYEFIIERIRNSGPTPQGTARHRKTPQDTHKTPQDTARHLQDTARDLKKDACKVIIDIQGYGGGGGGWGGGAFLLHFCTNCEKTKLGKKNFEHFFLVTSQFVQKCNKNVLPKNLVTIPSPNPPPPTPTTTTTTTIPLNIYNNLACVFLEVPCSVL